MARVDGGNNSGMHDSEEGTFEDEAFELGSSNGTKPLGGRLEEGHMKLMFIKKRKSMAAMDILMDMWLERFAGCRKAGQLNEVDKILKLPGC